MGIIVLGTVALDSIKTRQGFKRGLLGGSAAHFAMSASFFTQVNLAAVIGDDFPAKHITFLKKKNIILDSLRREKGCTFRWEGEYKAEDLNTACTLSTQLGVINGYVPKLNSLQKNIPNVFLGNYDPDIQYQFLKEINNPQLIGLDTMNLWIHNKKKSLLKILKKADILFINDAEAKALACEDNLFKAAKCLYSYGPKKIIIKKGEHGVFFYSRDCFFSLPAYPVRKVIDPTGAGDTFAGGVMGYLTRSPKINDMIFKNAVAYGTIISSFNVQGFGLKGTAFLKRDDIEKRLKEYRGFFKF